MRFGLLAGFMGLLASFGLSIAGCPSGEGADARLATDASDRPEVASPAPLPKPGTLQLLVISEARVRLGFKDGAVIQARLTDHDDQPVVGASISFALLGRPQDASLGQISALTDDKGVATTTIMSGQKVAAFNVRVSAPGAFDQLVDVAISDAGFGTLAVRARYYGARAVSERTVVIRGDASCAVLEDDGIGDAMMRLAEGQAEVQFLALPAGIGYAVLGYARGEDGTVVAQGCLEDVRVHADRSTNVVIQFSDEPISVGGELTLHADLLSDEVTSTLLVTARNAAIAAVVNDPSGRPAPESAEARFLFDSLDGVLRSDDWPGMRGLADDLTAARMLNKGSGSEPEVALQALLTESSEGALAAIDALGGHTGALLAHIGLDADLTIDGSGVPLALGVRTTRLSALGVARGVPPVVLDLPLDGEPLAATAVLEVEADRLMLESSELKVAFGALALQALRRAASSDGLGHGAELRAGMGCDRLGEWLASDAVPGASACDEACVAATCERAVARLLGAAETALLGLDLVRPTVTLAGPFELGDDDGDLQAERMSSDALTGSWTAPSSEVPTGDALTGSATVSAVESEADAQADSQP
jgi:hypothetical protein